MLQHRGDSLSGFGVHHKLILTLDFLPGFWMLTTMLQPARPGKNNRVLAPLRIALAALARVPVFTRKITPLRHRKSLTVVAPQLHEKIPTNILASQRFLHRHGRQVLWGRRRRVVLVFHGVQAVQVRKPQQKFVGSAERAPIVGARLGRRERDNDGRIVLFET